MVSVSIVPTQSVSPIVTEMICHLPSHFCPVPGFTGCPIKGFLQQTPCSSASSPWCVGVMLLREDAEQVGGEKLSGAQGGRDSCLWHRLGRHVPCSGGRFPHIPILTLPQA